MASGRTPIFSFETPTRERGSSRSIRHASAREVLREIVPHNTSAVSPNTEHRTARPSRDGSSTLVGNTAVTATPTATNPVTLGRGGGSTVLTPSNEQEMANDSVTREIKSLREQQKKLQASAARIEDTLKQLTTSQEQNFNYSSRRNQIPRALSTLVRDVYKRITDEEDMEWNFLARYSFDDQSNRDINSSVIRNVLAVSEDKQYDVSIIKRAARTYFKSRKNYHQRKSSGKQEATAAASRRRQRRHNKAHARLRALNQSKTLDDATKERIRPVLKAEFMSSEESGTEHPSIEQEASSGGSDTEQPPSRGKKRLIRHKLPWRSQEMQCIIESLDRKLERRRSDRAKTMCLQVVMGDDSCRPRPENLPEWATELFS